MDTFAGFKVAFRVHSRHMYPSERRDRTVAVDLPHAARERAVLRLSDAELIRAQGSPLIARTRTPSGRFSGTVEAIYL